MFEVWEGLEDVLEAEYIDNIYSDDLGDVCVNSRGVRYTCTKAQKKKQDAFNQKKIQTPTRGLPKQKPALKPKQNPIWKPKLLPPPRPVWQDSDPSILPPPPQANDGVSSSTAIVTTPPFNPTIKVDNNVSTDKWGWVSQVFKGGSDLINQWKGQPKEDFQVNTDRQLPATVVSGAAADLDINGQGAGFKVNWLMIAGVVVVIAAVLYGMTKKGR